jgi:hypothetical protein
VTDFFVGLRIIDISDSANPIFKSSYNTPGRGHRVALSENYAYVADYDSGLQIIDSSLEKITLTGTPDSIGIYKISIKACNEANECAIDTFNIIVTSLTITLIIIGSVTGAICTVSFCCPLIISGGVIALKRYRGKVKSDVTRLLINDTETDNKYHILRNKKENPKFLSII